MNAMKLLASAKDVEQEARWLIRHCSRVRCAVAWASHKCPAHTTLEKHESKIKQLTVGIHFYQTHPDFIEAFIDHKSVRFVMNPNGVFHPKVYLFEDNDNEWSAIVGSPNLTEGGFSLNSEVAVLITSADKGATEAYQQLNKTLDDFHKRGKQLTAKELSAYRAVWKRQLAKRGSLSGTYNPPGDDGIPKSTPLEASVFTDDWPTYFAKVQKDVHSTTKKRLAVLDQARQLFAQYAHFSDVPLEDRKGIAGFREKTPPEWLNFGSMKGHGYFKAAISQNNQFISEALDAIPLAGAVTKRDFDGYRRSFVQAFTYPGTATATRLLAMKRPDYFVCLDDANEKKLCRTFGITQKVKLEDYWDKVVARITDSNWWDSDEPTDKIERQVWQGRAAFLDVLFYEPKKRKRAKASAVV